LEDSVGEEEKLKTVAFVAASNESAILRRRAPELAVEVAQKLGQQGRRVLLLMDSVTRYAHALREIGISRNEPPVARGYPPSVFAELPKLMERTGPAATGNGSVTAIVTVLVDGDDHNDPTSDAMRGILDGHLVLDRAIAAQGRYPPVDPVGSISRMADRAWNADERKLVLELRKLISQFEETRDLRMLGGWRPGNDPQLDKAIRVVPPLYDALCQLPDGEVSTSAFDDLIPILKEHLKHENSQQEKVAQQAQTGAVAAKSDI
ncbi:MAG: flagellum-specific ATP synthase FliI, partial [Rhizobiaceae bacterium]